MGTLYWGLTVTQIKKQITTNVYVTKEETDNPVLTIDNMTLTNFPGDCGALCLASANHATNQKLKTVYKYASLSGFSKIFATVVGKEDFIKEAVAAFKANKWKCVYKGKSNRNPKKSDYVFVKYIKNC